MYITLYIIGRRAYVEERNEGVYMCMRLVERWWSFNVAFCRENYEMVE